MASDTCTLQEGEAWLCGLHGSVTVAQMTEYTSVAAAQCGGTLCARKVLYGSACYTSILRWLLLAGEVLVFLAAKARGGRFLSLVQARAHMIQRFRVPLLTRAVTCN